VPFDSTANYDILSFRNLLKDLRIIV